MRIGIDIGGTKIEGVLLDDEGEIICRQRLATPQQDYAATLKTISNLVCLLETESEVSLTSLPVGIATPGSISNVTGRMKNCNSTCLNAQRFREDLQGLLERDVRISNDADCFALSEATDGAAADKGTVFGVILGTGVGGGIVVNGELLCGPNSIAGEWGHNPMSPAITDPDWRKQTRHCYCGRDDCIETWLSGPGFEQSYYEQAGVRLNAAKIALLAAEGDKVASIFMDGYYDRLAAALATVVNVVDPEAIVLGGGLSNIKCLYTEVPKYWLNYVFTDHCETLLLPAKYGDSSGVRGAAWLW